uniref:uncharacterized protein LOC122579377 n=1 Tax=Erigeron canadensis TaxID=72917 RepID=UPI001CB912FE|nr:uncharacterized protein LOC122579377 [Erigeron canadensis]
MECNKDEALRAKEISEVKLAEKDYLGAKKFAQKAEKLCSGLEGLSHLLIIVDVYISFEKKINGEPDWYSVLGVRPTADDETIKKSYRKLILSLHPDKNRLVGAEGAFKLVSQAHALLSDKTKRKVYDQKRNPRSIYQPVIVTQKTTSTTQPTQPNRRPPNTTTFWTSCPKCLMQLEYSKVYLNQKILCPSDECHHPFWALELSRPRTNHLSTMGYPQRQNHNGNHHINIQQGSSINSSDVNRVNVQKDSSKNTSSVNNSGPFKSRREAKVGAMSYQTSISDGIAKKRHVTEQSSMVNACHKYAKVNYGGEKVNVSSTKSKLNNSKRELSQPEIRTMLLTKARKEILKKMDEWNVEKALKNEGTKKEGEISNSDKTKKYAEKVTVNGNKVTDVIMPVKDTMVTDEVDSDAKGPAAVLMSVPDPDFHDFDMDRTEHSFGENQIWAAYDEEDGMPRYYAMIHNVISRKPFKMEISWLNSKSNSELGPINWVLSGFPKTSGDYRMSKHEINTSLNSFSHKVQWTKGKRGVVHIYPQKGDVWALYRNWSSDWNEFTSDDVIRKYDMVVVIEGYTAEKGVKVAPLVKVAGFKSVFHQHADVAKSQIIPREEIFRMSHQVPFYMLTGEESLNVPNGCCELDPAALPLELLQTTIEPKVKSGEDGNLKRTEVKGIITYSRKKGKTCETSRTN